MYKKALLNEIYNSAFDNEISLIKEAGALTSVAKRVWTPLQQSTRSIKRTEVLKAGLNKALKDKGNLEIVQNTLQGNVSKYHKKGIGESIFGNNFGFRKKRLSNLKESIRSNQKFKRTADSRFGNVKGKISKYKSDIGSMEQANKLRGYGNTAARTVMIGGGATVAAKPTLSFINNKRDGNNGYH